MNLITFRKFFMIGGLALFILMSASYEARAQGRGRGKSNEDKKCAKFVNCHDASEGRLDGRGPRRGTDDDSWNWRRIRRDRDFDRDDARYRRNRRDRRFDRDDYWRDRNRNLDRERTWSRRGR
jgi:hypothetical protein